MGERSRFYWVTVICLMALVLYLDFVNGAGVLAPQPSPPTRPCSPVLLLNCIGSHKDHPSDKCCASLRSIAEDKCFCSRLRSGVVDASTYNPIAQACGIPINGTAKCKCSNAKDMLEQLRGKRLMFVGDSINLSQWESMVCMLQAVIPTNKTTIVLQSSLIIFKALDYNASVEFCWAPFLVQLRADSQKKRTLYLDSMEDNGIYWKGIDVLFFESSHRWQDKYWDLIMDGNKLYTDMDPMLAYQKALMAWENWVFANIDPKRSLVFFSTASPQHYNPSEWNEKNGHHCYNQTELVTFEGYRPTVPPQVPIVKEVVRSMGFPVTLMDITGLSQFHKDGHPSIYSNVFNSEEKKLPDKFVDCSHWCLPGIPDTWNGLLYVTLLFKGFAK